MAVAQIASAQEGEEIFKAKPCVACHAVETKTIGPGLKQIAQKYQNDPAAEGRLAGHIRNGTKGNWGNMPMPPNNVTEDEAKILSAWILSLK